MLKHFSLMLTLVLSLNLNAERVPVSTGHYIGGGIVGTLIGFGIGHAIQGRYNDRGWVFTVGEIGSLALVSGGRAWMVAPLKAKGLSYKTAQVSDLATGGIILTAIGGTLYSGLRIWEIIDVWAGATPVDNPKTASFFLNKDEKLFAGAYQLGIATLSAPLFMMNF